MNPLMYTIYTLVFNSPSQALTAVLLLMLSHISS